MEYSFDEVLRRMHAFILDKWPSASASGPWVAFISSSHTTSRVLVYEPPPVPPCAPMPVEEPERPEAEATDRTLEEQLRNLEDIASAGVVWRNMTTAPPVIAASSAVLHPGQQFWRQVREVCQSSFHGFQGDHADVMRVRLGCGLEGCDACFVGAESAQSGLRTRAVSAARHRAPLASTPTTRAKAGKTPGTCTE